MIIFLGLLAVVNAAKVLFSPSMLEPVHAYTMSHLANEMASRGHQVTWLEYGPLQSKVSLSKSISQKYLPAPFDDGELNALYVTREHPIYENMWDPYFDVENEQITGWMAGTRLCDRVLVRHKQTFDALVAEKFDTVVVDDLYNPCGLLLAGLKGSVYVYWSMTGLRPESAWANQSPNPPSYLPTPGTGLTDELSFFERIYNLAAYLKELYIHQHIVHTRIDAVFQKHYPGVESAFFLERNASINFVNTPPIFDFARPFMPRVNFVGGLHCHNATQLPSEIAKFVDSADEENGFVVISSGFNTQWDKAPEYVKDSFIDAFEANPNTKFVWQFTGDRRNIPSNVYVAEWLPLQDLLGHKKCRVHVTHGGLNSVIESVWHGVPVVGMPLTARGHDNLLRLTARGVGVMIKKNKLAKHGELTKKLEEIRDKKYKDEMLIFQDMVRDVPYTELNHAAFWIEFIERHQEVPHARSGADKLNVLQYFLVDVILFMLSVVAIFIAAVVFLLKVIWKIVVFLFYIIIGGRGSAPPKPSVSKAKKQN